METFLGQLFIEGVWMDYARSTEGPAREWAAADPERRRVVDWISKEVV